MKRCASCGREIAESATMCDLCERWADGIAVAPIETPAVSDLTAFPVEEPHVSAEPVIVSPVLHAPAVPEPAIAKAAIPPLPTMSPTTAPPPTPPPVAKPAAGSTLSRRELVIIGVALAVGAVLTFALLSSRGASTTLAAANRTPVKAASAPTPAPARPAAPVGTQKWSTARRAYWTANQHHSDAFELPAENTVAIWMNYVRPILVVRCMGKKTEAFVYTGSALKIEPNTEDHSVSFRFDDEAGRNDRWPDSAEHDALFAPDPVEFAHRIMNSRSLRFGYTPHNAEPVEAQFHTDGLAELIAPAAKDCGWGK